jgi:IrrE N-terminal-like domain
MSGTVVSVDCEAVRSSVAAAYRAAGLEHKYGVAAVAPLRKLVAAYPLAWYEVPDLTERTAAMQLHTKLGVPIDEPYGEDEPLSGRLYATGAGGCILVEQRHPLVRRRFTVAHELGHYIIHVLPRLAQGVTVFDEELLGAREEQGQDGRLAGWPSMIGNRGQLIPIDVSKAEEEADLFAAELLIPEPVCRYLVEANSRRCGGRQEVLARLLATECLVSETAMVRRLKELSHPEGKV